MSSIPPRPGIKDVCEIPLRLRSCREEHMTQTNNLNKRAFLLKHGFKMSGIRTNTCAYEEDNTNKKNIVPVWLAVCTYVHPPSDCVVGYTVADVFKQYLRNCLPWRVETIIKRWTVTFIIYLTRLQFSLTIHCFKNCKSWFRPL